MQKIKWNQGCVARTAHQLHRLCSQKVSQHNSISSTEKLEHKLWTDAYCHSFSILKSLVFSETDPWSLKMIHICAPELRLFLGCMDALFLCYMVECVTPVLLPQKIMIMISVVIVYDDNKKNNVHTGLFFCCMVECGTPFRPIKPYALSGLIVSRSPLSPILVRIPLTKLPQPRHR